MASATSAPEKASGFRVINNHRLEAAKHAGASEVPVVWVDVDGAQMTVWEWHHGESDTGHGTQKPLECMARPIRNHRGDVYDPFVGSGTTIVAAEQEARVCYGMEIEPAYVAVILERLSGMGLTPALVEL